MQPHTIILDINRGPMVIIDRVKCSRKKEHFEHNFMLRINGVSGPMDNEFACMAAATSGSYLGGHWHDQLTRLCTK